MRAIQHRRPYLWGRKFVLITDFSALMWLFKSQALSSKLHRWALRLMEYHMDLQWRLGANHQMPDALSTLSLSNEPGTDIDDSFPDDSSTRTTNRGPRGPVLDGVFLRELGADEVDKPTGKNAAVTASVSFTPGRADGTDIEKDRHDTCNRRAPSSRGALLRGGRWSHGSERAGCSQGGNRP